MTGTDPDLLAERFGTLAEVAAECRRQPPASHDSPAGWSRHEHRRHRRTVLAETLTGRPATGQE